MWYKPNDEPYKKPDGLSSADARLVSLLAQKVVRRMLIENMKYVFSQEDVDYYTRRILGMVKDKYGDFDKIRYKTDTVELLPFIEKCAKRIIK